MGIFCSEDEALNAILIIYCVIGAHVCVCVCEELFSSHI